MSEKIPRAPEPDNERTSIIGIVSAGTLNFARSGAQTTPICSIIPEARNIDIATIMATKYGINLDDTSSDGADR